MKRYVFIGLVISAVVAALSLLTPVSRLDNTHSGGGSRAGTLIIPPTVM